MIQIIAWIFMIIAAGNLWGGWGVILVIAWLVDRIVNEIK